jgi:hypothetical protein
MSLPNRNLAILSMVAKILQKDVLAEALKRCAYLPDLDGQELSGPEVAAILATADIGAITYVSGPGEVPDLIQDAADMGHIVLCLLDGNQFTDYQHWGLLEIHRGKQTRIITLYEGTRKGRQAPMKDTAILGTYVICRDRIDVGTEVRRLAGHGR